MQFGIAICISSAVSAMLTSFCFSAYILFNKGRALTTSRAAIFSVFLLLFLLSATTRAVQGDKEEVNRTWIVVLSTHIIAVAYCDYW
jgi:hypothetical protein